MVWLLYPELEGLTSPESGSGIGWMPIACRTLWPVSESGMRYPEPRVPCTEGGSGTSMSWEQCMSIT